MKFRNFFLLAGVLLFAACGGELPQTAPTSYQTMTISKSDIVLPLKYSATLKGTSDVTIMPQVSGQLTEVCITEGQQVKKGDVLFRIDSRNAQLELESAEANLLAAQAQESSAKLEFESTQNLFEKGIVSRYMLESAENSYKQAQASVAQYRATADRARVNAGGRCDRFDCCFCRRPGVPRDLSDDGERQCQDVRGVLGERVGAGGACFVGRQG